MDTPGFITPPPNLIPPRHDTDTHTQRAPARPRGLPVFLPAQVGVPAPEPTRGWLVVLPDGSAIPITQPLLLGRNPVTFEPWTGARLVVLDDPTRSVSKTHAVIESVGDGVEITDLHSTNGVIVSVVPGAERELVSARPELVRREAQVWLGRFALRIAPA